MLSREEIIKTLQKQYTNEKGDYIINKEHKFWKLFREVGYEEIKESGFIVKKENDQWILKEKTNILSFIDKIKEDQQKIKIKEIQNIEKFWTLYQTGGKTTLIKHGFKIIKDDKNNEWYIIRTTSNILQFTKNIQQKGEKIKTKDIKNEKDFWALYNNGGKKTLNEHGYRIQKIKDEWTLYKSENITPEIQKTREIVYKKEDIKGKYGTESLLEHQIEHTKTIIQAIKNYKSALDASDTGTGKTYTALATASELEKFPIIICPKTIIGQWQETLEKFNINGYISNYEQFVRGNTPYYKKPKEKRKKGEWDIPQNCIIILDEAHYLKHITSQRSRMVNQLNEPCLFLSATIAEKIQHTDVIGRKLQIFKTLGSYMNAYGYKKNKYGQYHHAATCNAYKFGYSNCGCGGGKEILNRIKNIIHNKDMPRGSRMNINDVKDIKKLFIHIHSLSIEEEKQKLIENTYLHAEKETKEKRKQIEKIRKEIQQAKEKTEMQRKLATLHSEILTEMLRARQIAEFEKIEAITQMADDEIQEGSSIVITFSFKDSVHKCAELLRQKKHDVGIIIGRTGKTENDKEDNYEIAKKFREDKLRVVVCTIKSGGQSISLHDEYNGKYPRIALINNDWEAINLKQTIGRVRRTGSKTQAICKILYIRGTIEEKIATRVQEKLEAIETINNEEIKIDITENAIYET